MYLVLYSINPPLVGILLKDLTELKNWICFCETNRCFILQSYQSCSYITLAFYNNGPTYCTSTSLWGMEKLHTLEQLQKAAGFKMLNSEEDRMKQQLDND